MKARVFVTLKPSVFDPQGRAIVEALHSLGYGGVADVRQGKYFELDVDATTTDEAQRLATDVATRVLSNPVIESFRLEIADAETVGDTRR
jgi:phosphoribosylformylglycinamidine synthase PurS subunit